MLSFNGNITLTLTTLFQFQINMGKVTWYTKKYWVVSGNIKCRKWLLIISPPGLLLPQVMGALRAQARMLSLKTMMENVDR